ncbi:hypothetical protein [Streptomyces sp. NPDC086989]|uniref:hypothetical protein n=1 Tax=Streptomyces sp. NPDC086989 TaxID=3365764 RepID=UPI0037F2B5AF
MIDLKDVEGWVVTGHHNDVLTYVGPDEPQDQSQIAVRLFGRSRRQRDGTEPRIAKTEHLLRVVDPLDDSYRRQMNRQLTVQESRYELGVETGRHAC